jgi:hypothetical protein
MSAFSEASLMIVRCVILTAAWGNGIDALGREIIALGQRNHGGRDTGSTRMKCCGSKDRL